MKRIFSIFMIICLLACMACFAACSPDKLVVDEPPVVVPETDNPIIDEIDEFDVKFGSEWISGNEGEGVYYAASMLGEGSPAMIIALLALAASVVSICLNVALYKKLAALTSAKDDEETDGEE